MLKKSLMLMGAAAIALALFFVTSGPASAGWPHPHPIVYNQDGGSIPMYGAPSDEPGMVVQHWLENSEEVRIHCWVSADESGANYRTAKWFKVTEFDEGHHGWVNASWVYYQDAEGNAPHCDDGYFGG